MIGGSLALTLFGWCFVGLLLFLLWFSGKSDSLLFHLIFQISFWAGIGFIIIMSIASIIMAILEKLKK